MKTLRCVQAVFMGLALFLSLSSTAGPAEDAKAAYDQGDYPTAFRIWSGLAEQGNAEAQANLGGMYRDGQGVPNDDAAAAAWIRRSAEQGYGPAQTDVGLMYVQKSLGETSSDRLGAAKDDTVAAAWFRKAADQGYAPAQTYLGLMYARGQGVPRDNVEAVQWYRKAAEQGFAAAQTNLGFMYESGRGVAKDDTEAVQWYRKAAAQDYALAQSNLANMYKSGRGVAQNDAIQPAVDRTVVTKTYAVASMVGGRLSFVTRKFTTGSRLDHYDRRIGALQDDTIATAVLRTMANAVVEVAPAAKTELLEIEIAASQGSENVASDELLAVARRALTNIVVGRSLDFIVLLGPRRESEDAHLLGPNLVGLGFYVDPGTSQGFRSSRVPGDIVKADRFISPFVSSQVWLLDAKTLDVVATQSIYGYCRYANGESDSPNPWQFFDAKTMLHMLTLVIQHDVGESTKVVIRKGLGMPEVLARQHVEFCSHRYDWTFAT